MSPPSALAPAPHVFGARAGCLALAGLTLPGLAQAEPMIRA